MTLYDFSHHHRIALVLSLLLGINSALAQSPIIYTQPEIYLPATAAKATTLDDSALLLNPTTAAHISLGPVTAEEQQQLKALNNAQKPLFIGTGRSTPDGILIDSESLNWTLLANGDQVAMVIISSADAQALRVKLEFTKALPATAKFRFFDPQSQQIIASASGTELQQAQPDHYWSPTVTGDQLGLEIVFAAGSNANASPFKITQLSHLFATVGEVWQKNLIHIGLSGSCNIDVACVQTTDLSLQASIASVAKYIVTFASGATGICTGELLVDTDNTTFFPYFFTANHCINNTVTASNMEFYWNFQRTNCGGPNPTTVTRQGGGATLLATGANTDYTLLQLNQNPPANVGLSGWTNAIVETDSEVIGVHHPQGDLKKISFGTTQEFATRSGEIAEDGQFILTEWFDGTTEKGSSGSGIWTEVNGQLLFVGGLFGGLASCQNPQEPDYYGRFDLTFAELAPWLNPNSDALTNVWRDPNRNGQGVQIMRDASQVSGAWYLYDENGDGLWVTFIGNLAANNQVNANLLRFTGPNLGTSWNNALVQPSVVGNVTIEFTSLQTALFDYTINGVSDSLNLQPFSNTADGKFTKVWWDRSQTGQGVQILHDGNTISGAWYLYDENGNGLWVTFVGMLTGNTVTADLLRFTGSELGTVWDNGELDFNVVGSVTIQFQSDSAAQMNYTLNGVSGSLNLEPFEL